MRSKQIRQARIRELLQEEAFETHEMLAAALHRQGLRVSQSTLSKDLRELGVVRMPCPEGGFRYAMPDLGATPRDLQLLERELRDYQVQVDRAQHLVVIRTRPGHAQSACAAIDHMAWPEILGTLAGDDTILVVAPTPRQAEAVLQRLRGMVQEVNP